LNERTRLNSLLSNLQSMQNERERQENESRRRTLQETERLEGEVQSLKSQLTEESEETKRLASRREFESRDLQERIDKTNADLASAREKLAAASTARDQLQARVEEQAILLKSSEEKLAVLSKPGSSTQDVNREQQLEVEISELKKALELTKAELRDAREYADKMKEISATAEEALQDMNTAHDKFKETMDRQLAEKEVTTMAKTTLLRCRVNSVK
jgi:nucleoprotein TPR